MHKKTKKQFDKIKLVKTGYKTLKTPSLQPGRYVISKNIYVFVKYEEASTIKKNSNKDRETNNVALIY